LVLVTYVRLDGGEKRWGTNVSDDTDTAPKQQMASKTEQKINRNKRDVNAIGQEKTTFLDFGLQIGAVNETVLKWVNIQPKRILTNFMAWR
jgi:hypothetical protein